MLRQDRSLLERDQAVLAQVVQCKCLQAILRVMLVALWPCMLVLVPKVALSTYGVELYRSLRAPATLPVGHCASQRLKVLLRWLARVLPCSAAAVGILG